MNEREGEPNARTRPPIRKRGVYILKQVQKVFRGVRQEYPKFYYERLEPAIGHLLEFAGQEPDLSLGDNYFAREIAGCAWLVYKVDLDDVWIVDFEFYAKPAS